MWSDLRYAARTLARSPAFALTAILALALGIGANTAIFSVINSLLLHPPGLKDPDRIVALRINYDRINLKNIVTSVPDYANVRDSRNVFSSAVLLGMGNFSYANGGAPERLVAERVTGQPFEVLGLRPLLGRGFLPEEDRPGANHVVILTYGTWQRIFGSDPHVLGRTMELDSEPYRIVGVLGPEYYLPPQVDIWVPYGLAADAYDPVKNRHSQSYVTLARLVPGVSFERAAAYVKVMAEQILEREDQNGRARASGWGMFLMPLVDLLEGDLRKPMLVLGGAVVFVLLIACSNIAGLLLARASGRGREIAVRAALGAGRWRLIRQVLAESALLSAAGGVLGLGVGKVGVALLRLIAPERQTAGLVIPMDARVLAFAAAAAILSGLLFGLAPAWQLARSGHFEMLKEGGRSGTAGRARQRLRSVLVMAEFALSLVLLVGAGLFLRSLARLEEVRTGFDPHGLMTGVVQLPRNRYTDDASRTAFYRAALERLAAIPGVQAAAMGVPMPFSGGNNAGAFQIEGRQQAPGEPQIHGEDRWVSPGYFRTLKIPLIEGRVFTEQDRAGAEPVAMIDENLAKQYWPNRNPLGQRIKTFAPPAQWCRIVGIVAHVRQMDLTGEASKGVYYFPLWQNPLPYGTFAIRTAGDPLALAGAMRQAIRAVDPAQPVADLKSMDQRVAETLGARRFAVTLLGVFAGLAMLLAAMGIYGVISYAVAQRTQEIGIRMALGAGRGSVLGMVLGQALRLAAGGVAAGMIAAAALARLVESQLFQTSEFDPATFGAMAVVLSVVAVAASYIPARRATRVDPVVALRWE
jgi:predicted permease